MRTWLKSDVWQALATELRSYRQLGLGPLLTEDAVRFATARTLVEHGSDPQDLRVELPHPELKGSRIDLVVGRPPMAFIEFKYPRETNEKNAAWTMTLGEVLKDFYRLAACTGSAERLFVYVETPRLRRYMAGVAQRHGIALDVDEVVLPPDAMAQLPMTARRSIGLELHTSYVRARRSVVVDVDEGLRLAVYQVDPAQRY